MAQKAGPVSQWVVETLLKKINNGEFGEGRLPAERFLCSELGVSRTALRSALAKLEESGAVERIHGRGTFVRSQSAAAKARTRPTVSLFHGLAPVDLSVYYRGIVNGILWEAADRGLDLLFAHLPVTPDPAETAAALSGFELDGAMMLAFQEDQMSALPSVGMPLVLVDMPGTELSCAMPDDELGAREAVRYLAGELGHQRISYVLWSRHQVISQYRLGGYRKGLEEHGLGGAPDLVTESGPEYSGYIKAAERLMSLDESPTAIICDNEVIARGVIEGVRGCGRQVPGEVSVMSIGAAGAIGQLAAVTFDVEEIGRAAVRELTRLMEMPFSKARRTVIPPRLVRGSTCSQAG